MSQQVSSADVHGTHTSFRTRLTCSRALAAPSPRWSAAFAPLTNTEPGRRSSRGGKHGYAEPLNRPFIQELSPITHRQALDLLYLVLQNRGLTLPGKPAHLSKGLLLLRVSLNWHTQPWRVTRFNGADGCPPFPFVVLQQNRLPLHTLRARAGRSAASLCSCFYTHSLIHLLKTDCSITKSKDKQETST